MAYIPPTDWELRDFYREHADTVYRSCMLFTGGQADARAMTKEIFLKLLDQGMEFSTSADAKAWMILSAHKMRRKALKKAKRAPLPEEKAVEDPVLEEAEETCVSPENSPETDAQAVQGADAPLSQDEFTEPEAVESEDTAAISEESEVQERDETLSEPQSSEAEPEESEACTSAGEETEAKLPSEPEVGPKEILSVREPAESEQLCTENALTVYPDIIMKLSARDRVIAVMYYCEGFRRTEIAAYLGCTGFMIRGALSRINRVVSSGQGKGIVRRTVRDAYNQESLLPEESDAVMEALVAERLKSTDRRGKKWSPPGQWGSWLLIILLAAAIIIGLYTAAHHFGIVAAIQEKTQELSGKLEEIAPADTTLPVQTDAPTEDTEQPTFSTDDIMNAYGSVIDRYILSFEEEWDMDRCEQEGISYLVMFQADPEKLSYVLTDLDEDGIEELIISDGRVIYDLYTYLDGGLFHVLSGAERNAYMLTADNILINTGSNGAASSVYGFYRYIGGALVVDQLVVLDAGKDPQNPWFRGFTQENLAPITEAEAQTIIDSYVNIPIQGTPITQWG